MSLQLFQFLSEILKWAVSLKIYFQPASYRIKLMARVQKGSIDKIYYLCEGKKTRCIQMDAYFPQKYISDKGNIALLLRLLLIFTAARTGIMLGTLQLFYLYFRACWVHMAQEKHLSHYFKNFGLRQELKKWVIII